MKKALATLKKGNLKEFKTVTAKLDQDAFSKLLLDAASESKKDICQYLIEEKKANIKICDSNGKNALHLGLNCGVLLTYLIQKGADIDKKDVLGNSPLFYAVSEQKVDAVNALVPKSNKKVTSNDGRTPLFPAAERCSTEILTILLNNRFDPNTPNYQKVTPLHLACQFGRKENVEILLQYKANINAQDAKGDTPLHYAARNDRLEICKFLIEEGVNHQVRNSDGYRPFEVAPNQLGREIIEFVINRILNIDSDQLNNSHVGQCRFCLASISVLEFKPCLHVQLCDDCYINHKDLLKACPLCHTRLETLTQIE